jgi:hypothetical protein
MVDHLYIYIYIEDIEGKQELLYLLISKDNHKKIERKSKVTFGRQDDIPLEKMNIF